MDDNYAGRSPQFVRVEKPEKPIPTIRLLDSDCNGAIPEVVQRGKSVLLKAEKDHQRYWREMVGTYLRNELNLSPELPSSTKFRLKLPRSYQLCARRRRIKEKWRWDYYLIGFHCNGTREVFDSPANFVKHAKWLAYGRPDNACECKFCSGRLGRQREISNDLTVKLAHVERPVDETAEALETRRRVMRETGIVDWGWDG